MAKKKAVQKDLAATKAPGEKRMAAKKQPQAQATRALPAVMEPAIGEAKATPAADKAKKERPVRCIHRHTDMEFRREYRKVCDALITKALEGGIAHTRLLLTIGKFGEPKALKRRGAKSLSALLLEELKRRQDEQEAAMDAAAAHEAKETAADSGQTETGTEGAASGDKAEKR